MVSQHTGEGYGMFRNPGQRSRTWGTFSSVVLREGEIPVTVEKSRLVYVVCPQPRVTSHSIEALQWTQDWRTGTINER